jgi:ribulose-phosphate 3-epimerase
VKIYPSLISADILNLREVIKNLDSHCEGYHIDVMDDHFVPNLTWGSAFVNAIRKETSLPIHLHLMVDNPKKWVDRVELKKDDIFIFHWEVTQNIPELDCQVGVAINPGTPVEEIYQLLEKIDHVLLMSVEPGFSGQKFMPEVVKKVAPLIDLREKNNLSFSIGMDGGVGEKNISILEKEGIDVVGVASAIFSNKNYVDALKSLYKLGK